MIGTFGPVVFVASAETVRTFDDLSRKEQGRWAKHDVVLKKPVSEFLGPDLGTVTFKMRFDASLGVNPRKEMDKLLEMVRDGKAYPLIIGGKGLGLSKWSLQDISQDWKYLENRGHLIVGEVTVNLEEYI